MSPDSMARAVVRQRRRIRPLSKIPRPSGSSRVEDLRPTVGRGVNAPVVPRRNITMAESKSQGANMTANPGLYPGAMMNRPATTGRQIDTSGLHFRKMPDRTNGVWYTGKGMSVAVGNNEDSRAIRNASTTVRRIRAQRGPQ